jgi:hypothetical protein
VVCRNQCNLQNAEDYGVVRFVINLEAYIKSALSPSFTTKPGSVVFPAAEFMVLYLYHWLQSSQCQREIRLVRVNAVFKKQMSEQISIVKL